MTSYTKLNTNMMVEGSYAPSQLFGEVEVVQLAEGMLLIEITAQTTAMVCS